MNARVRENLENALCEAYLDWANNYLTTDKFAEDYGLTNIQARHIINAGRHKHNERVANHLA